MKWTEYPLVELVVSLLVLMAMFAAVKLLMTHLPDGGVVGDVKHFFALA
jgi:hypothetical protein